MDKQNITLSLPKDVLREAKHLAVDQGISLSGFLVEALKERVKRLREIERAGARQRALMRRGLKLVIRVRPSFLYNLFLSAILAQAKIMVSLKPSGEKVSGFGYFILVFLSSVNSKANNKSLTRSSWRPGDRS